MEHKKSQRRIRNLLLQPFLQVRFGFYHILLSSFFAIAFGALVVFSFDQLFGLVLDLTDSREQVLGEITEQLNIVYGWLALFLVGYVLAVTSVSVLFTHRLIGPTIAFRRHIRALIDGDFDSRVVLRKYDAFPEVAADLNELAVCLAKAKSKP